MLQSIGLQRVGLDLVTEQQIFIEKLFTIAIMWTQLKCSSTDERIKNTIYTYNGIPLSP